MELCYFGLLIGGPVIRHAVTLIRVRPLVITQGIIQLEVHSTLTHNQLDLIAVSLKGEMVFVF
jgi:hypothetical protein